MHSGVRAIITGGIGKTILVWSVGGHESRLSQSDLTTPETMSNP